MKGWSGALTGHDGHNGAGGERKSHTLDRAQLNWLLKAVFFTRPEELGCDECFEVVDAFAELELAGKNAAEAMPLVQDHLDRCPPCREEFGALLDALRAVG